ncbi:MAG: hybrid sensor histidine kinase/response regulator [Spirochaetia bacterium]
MVKDDRGIPDSRILIVDDVPQNITIAKAILKKDGHYIETAERGDLALQVVDEQDIDLVLLDIMMPEVDGFTVAEKLQKNEKTKDIPIIFLTARNDTESITRGFKIGAVDYITKPFRGEELRMRVGTHLRLRHTQQKLREANASKDKFFSIIAHDLRSPFTALVGMAQYLAKGIDTLDPETAKEFLEGMHKSSKNAFNLLENLLEWSRIQTGKLPMSPKEVKLYDVLDDNLSLLWVNIENKDITIENNLEKNEQVWADENAVHTIFRNLLSNAVKFTPKEGVISIYSHRIEEEVVVTVKDSGVGMDNETLENLFRIDRRSNTTRGTEKEKGTGLGLILCKEFVERNHGTLSVESEPGRGSMFSFALPAEPVTEEDE